jgi:hypothetical protein
MRLRASVLDRARSVASPSGPQHLRLANVAPSVEEVTMATADEVRDALFERIAYHAISADTDEVLTLAKAYNLLVEGDEDDDEDDEDEDDD